VIIYLAKFKKEEIKLESVGSTSAMQRGPWGQKEMKDGILGSQRKDFSFFFFWVGGGLSEGFI
jgi:hypothetical protein